MAADQIKRLYDSMPAKLAEARRRFGRPLTLAEKILVSHADDFDTQEWDRGKAHPPAAPRPRRHAGRHGADGAPAVHARRACHRSPCPPRCTATT